MDREPQLRRVALVFRPQESLAPAMPLAHRPPQFNVQACQTSDISDVRRGAFREVAEPRNAIVAYIDGRSSNPTPFAWAEPAERILKKSAEQQRARETPNGMRH